MSTEINDEKQIILPAPCPRLIFTASSLTPLPSQWCRVGNGVDGHSTTALLFSSFLFTLSPRPTGMSPHHTEVSKGSPQTPTAPSYTQPKNHLYFKRHFYKFCIYHATLGSISSLRYRGDVNRRGLVYWSHSSMSCTGPDLWVLLCSSLDQDEKWKHPTYLRKCTKVQSTISWLSVPLRDSYGPLDVSVTVNATTGDLGERPGCI